MVRVSGCGNVWPWRKSCASAAARCCPGRRVLLAQRGRAKATRRLRSGPWFQEVSVRSMVCALPARARSSCPVAWAKCPLSGQHSPRYWAVGARRRRASALVQGRPFPLARRRGGRIRRRVFLRPTALRLGSVNMPNNREETYNKHHTRQTDGALRFGVLLSCHPKPPHCA